MVLAVQQGRRLVPEARGGKRKIALTDIVPQEFFHLYVTPSEAMKLKDFELEDIPSHIRVPYFHEKTRQQHTQE